MIRATRNSGRNFVGKPHRSAGRACRGGGRRCCWSHGRSGGGLDNARIGSDFIDDVSKMSPNRVAVVAEVEEEWTTPIDTRMEAIGGTVFRRGLADARDASDSKEVAAMKADLAQMKAEHGRGSG